MQICEFLQEWAKNCNAIQFLPVTVVKRPSEPGVKTLKYDRNAPLVRVAGLIDMTFLDSNLSICMKSLEPDVLCTVIPLLRVYNNKNNP